MAVIFSYNADTRAFNTYASWVVYMLGFPRNEVLELIYALETTFFHTFPCVNSKDDLEKGITYHLHGEDNRSLRQNPRIQESD